MKLSPSDFFVFWFSLDNSCIAPFLAMWMHSYDWLETGLFPADSKIESISSFSERGGLFGFFSREKNKNFWQIKQKITWLQACNQGNKSAE